MRIFALISSLLLVSSTSFAQSYGVFGGFNSSVYDNDVADFDREFGLELGFEALLTIQSGLIFRTGAGIVGKNSSAESAGLRGEFGLTYLQFPATVMFVATSTVSIFGGLNLNLLISDHCELNGVSCSIQETETLMISLPLGARFHLQGPHYIEPIIEFGMTDAMGDTKVSNSIAGRYVYMF